MNKVNIGNWRLWSTRVIPLVYDGTLTQPELLYKLYYYIVELMKNYKELNEVFKGIEIDIDQLQADTQALFDELEKVRNGDYVSLYLDSLINWIDKNIQNLVGDIVKYMWAGLSLDGRFMVVIPHSWDFIHFDTVADYNEPLFGHLTLTWEVLPSGENFNQVSDMSEIENILKNGADVNAQSLLFNGGNTDYATK